MPNKLEVLYHDNRGNETTPFGFVYLSDGSRCLYAKGEVRPYEGPYWSPAGVLHVVKSVEYLRGLGMEVRSA